MSRSENKNANDDNRKSRYPDLDDLAKMVAIVVAIFGTGKYFYDKSDSARNERRAQSIMYIENYANSELIAARQTLYKFWVGQPNLVAVLRQESLSLRSYEAMLRASVFRQGADENIRESLLLLDSFYSQMSYCRSGGLCDPDILDTYFCGLVQRDALAYRPFFSRLRELSGYTSLGETIYDYAQLCEEN